MAEIGALSKGLRRRAEILAVARNLLIESGYHGFVLREIASGAGISLGNLQYYFPTREALLGALAEAEAENDIALLAVFSDDTRGAAVRLAELARTLLVRWSGDAGRIYAVALFLSVNEASFRKAQRKIYQRFFEQLLPVLQELAPRRRRAAQLDKARLITALLDGALLQMQSGGANSTAKRRDRFIDQIVEQVVATAT